MEIDSTVKGLVDVGFGTMKDILLKGEEVLPLITYYALENGHPAIFPVAGLVELFSSDEVKRKLPGAIKTLWNRITSSKSGLKLVAVLMASDSWIENVSDEEAEKLVKEGRKVPFTPKPGEQEALVIQVTLEDQNLLFQLPYVKGGGEIVFKEVIEKTESFAHRGARLSRLWPL